MSQLDEDFGLAICQSLAGPEIEGNPFQRQLSIRLQGNERFGAGGPAQFLDIARNRRAADDSCGILADHAVRCAVARSIGRSERSTFTFSSRTSV